MNPAAWARSRGQLDLVQRGVRPRVGDVVRDRVREQERIVVDDRDRAAQRDDVDVAHVRAVDQHRPRARVIQPRQQLHERGLARARRAHQRDRRARLDRQRDVAQGVRTRPVAEGHVAQLHAPAPRRQRRGAADDRRLAVEDLEQPRARRGRALRHAERDAEHPHRPDQHQQVRVEGGEVAQRQRPVDDLAPAHEQDHGQADVRQEGQERVVERALARGDHRLVEDARHIAAEALELARLGREGLDHAHAGDVLLDVRGDLGDPLLDLLQRRPRAAPVARGHDDHERHRDQRQRGQPGGEPEHRRPRRARSSTRIAG